MSGFPATFLPKVGDQVWYDRNDEWTEGTVVTVTKGGKYAVDLAGGLGRVRSVPLAQLMPVEYEEETGGVEEEEEEEEEGGGSSCPPPAELSAKLTALLGPQVGHPHGRSKNSVASAAGVHLNVLFMFLETGGAPHKWKAERGYVPNSGQRTLAAWIDAQDAPEPVASPPARKKPPPPAAAPCLEGGGLSAAPQPTELDPFLDAQGGDALVVYAPLLVKLGVRRPGDLMPMSLAALAAGGVKKLHARRLKNSAAVFQDYEAMQQEDGGDGDAEAEEEAEEEASGGGGGGDDEGEEEGGGEATAAAAAAAARVSEASLAQARALAPSLVAFLETLDAHFLAYAGPLAEAGVMRSELEGEEGREEGRNATEPLSLRLPSFLSQPPQPQPPPPPPPFPPPPPAPRPGDFEYVSAEELVEFGVAASVEAAALLKSEPAVFLDAQAEQQHHQRRQPPAAAAQPAKGAKGSKAAKGAKGVSGRPPPPLLPPQTRRPPGKGNEEARARALLAQARALGLANPELAVATSALRSAAARVSSTTLPSSNAADFSRDR